MWHSLLQYESPDRSVRSLRRPSGGSAPGRLAAGPVEDVVLIAPGHGLHYILDSPLLEVVGLSCVLRFRPPGGAIKSSLVLCRLGEAFDLSLEPLTTARARVDVRLHGARQHIGQLSSPSPGFVELRFDWRTNGRTFLRVDNRLVGYHDAWGRGAQLTIADVAFGIPGSTTASPGECYQLGRFSVSAICRRPRWPRRQVPVVHGP